MTIFQSNQSPFLQNYNSAGYKQNGESINSEILELKKNKKKLIFFNIFLYAI